MVGQYGSYGIVPPVVSDGRPDKVRKRCWCDGKKDEGREDNNSVLYITSRLATGRCTVPRIKQVHIASSKASSSPLGSHRCDKHSLYAVILSNIGKPP